MDFYKRLMLPSSEGIGQLLPLRKVSALRKRVLSKGLSVSKMVEGSVYGSQKLWHARHCAN